MAFSAFYRRPTFNGHPKRKGGPAKAQTRRRAPPSSALINAVLEHADLRDDLGGGRVMLRLSPSAQADTDLRDALGKEASRLADVAVIWDEREEAVFRVLDGGPPPLAAVPAAPPGEDDHFMLTPAALAYVAQSQSRGRG